jgi:hypothetical protein
VLVLLLKIEMAAEFPGWALAERKKIKDALSDASFAEKLARFQETTSDAQFVIECVRVFSVVLAVHAHDSLRLWVESSSH